MINFWCIFRSQIPSNPPQIDQKSKLEPLWALLELSWGVLGSSWSHLVWHLAYLGAVLATLEGHLAYLGVVLATLEGFWKDSGESQASFQVDLGDPKPVQKRSQNKV